MHIIKLSATDSTNTYLKKLSTKSTIKDYTCIVTDNQTKGRGQVGTIWSSEPGKNLVFSVFKDLEELQIELPFSVSMIVSLSILESLNGMDIPKLSIKWPNDIMSDNKKICGILIENVIKKNKLNSSIIGIGLNVHQKNFKSLPNASSLKLVTKKNYNLDELLIVILNKLKFNFSQNHLNLENLKKKYELELYKKNISAKFKNAKGSLFQGTIQGVSKLGKLIVLADNGILEEYDLKEITLMD